MPIYEQVMSGEGGPLGTEAVIDDAPLPDFTLDMYEQMFGGALSDQEAFLSGGAPQPTIREKDRGAAIRQEDVGAVSGAAGKIVRAAQGLVGTPYVWGGTSTSGVDCSGLVQLAYKAAGINLPRVSYQQASMGRTVRVGELKPGDLVAWDNSRRNDGADHIAIYIGGGRIIEAPRPGEQVRVRKLGNDEGAWGVRIMGGK